MTTILPKGTKVRIKGDSQYAGVVCEILSYNPGIDEVQYTTVPVEGVPTSARRLYLNEGDFELVEGQSTAVIRAQKALAERIEEIEKEREDAMKAFDDRIETVRKVIFTLESL